MLKELIYDMVRAAEKNVEVIKTIHETCKLSFLAEECDLDENVPVLSTLEVHAFKA